MLHVFEDLLVEAVCTLAFALQVSRVTRGSVLSGGSLFLFDRKAVRFFRKDNHNWRKKADGKTVRETHEKLKVSTFPPPCADSTTHSATHSHAYCVGSRRLTTLIC